MTGLEPLAVAAVGGVATVVTETLFGKGGKWFGGIGSKINERTKQAIFNASRQYVENYRERHGILKVLGMREPIGLESVYTTVQLLDEWGIRNFASVKDLEKSFRKNSKRRFRAEKCQKEPGIKIANQKQYLMVLGAPGSGKSTFLRKTGLEALKVDKGKFQHRCLPVFLELKRFTEPKIDLKAVISQEFTTCGFPSAEEFTQKALEEGKLLILLDGLDEVPTQNLSRVIQTIEDFVDQYDKNRFITSCRTAAYRSSFRRFSDLGIADFDDGQIEQFISNWFCSENDKKAKTSEKCWQLLQEPENKAAKELAQTPLLLTFLCLVYDRSQNFPDNRSTLYRKALRILLEEWASEKRILRDDIYQGLNTELEEVLLAEIAYKGFKEDRLFFPQQDIVEEIRNFLGNNLNAPQHLDGEAVLNAIEVQQGILIQRAEDIYSFSHLTLQEYLTAQYITDNNKLQNLVVNHLTDKRWREVFLLVAGLMRNGADDLLLFMEKQTQQILKTSLGKRLLVLFAWAEEMTEDSSSEISPLGKRAIVIANALALAYTYGNALANGNALALANALAYANPLANGNANPLAYANANPLAYANANANAIAYADACGNANGNALALAYTYANALEKLIDYANRCEKLEIFERVNFPVLITRLKIMRDEVPDREESIEVYEAFTQRIIKTWLDAFHLTQEMINFSKEELKEIDNYFYSNLLMLQ